MLQTEGKSKCFIITKCKNPFHLDHRSHRCIKCGKLFKESGNLITHMRIHVIIH